MTQAKNSVKVGTNYKWFIGVVAVLLLLVTGFLAFGERVPEGYLSAEDAQLATDTAVADLKGVKDAELGVLTQQIADMQIAEETEAEEESLLGYLLDELFLGDLLSKDVFSDREISTLFDGEVRFDGDDYDAEETLTLKDIKLLVNENDFEGKVFMTVPEGAVEYKLEFETDLDTSLIDDDETFFFNFLGQELEVSSWDNDEITFTSGIEHFLSEGEMVDNLKLEMVLDEAVYITVDNEGKKIREGETANFNDLEVFVKEVMYSGYSGGYHKAVLVIGEDVESEVENGEEFEEDSAWEWVISSNSIGLILVEDFTEVDLDGEDFPAVGAGETLCLPNEYICIKFNGMAEVETEEYTFELDGDFVRVKGNFESGTNDYDRIYINTTGIYSDDDADEDTKNLGFSIELGNTDSILNISSGELVFEDFKVNFALNDSKANGKGLNSFDEDFLTDFGLLVTNPEDSAEDQEFSVFVPQEKLEGSLSLIG